MEFPHCSQGWQAPGIILTDGTDCCAGFGSGGKLFVFQRYVNRRSYTFETEIKDGIWSQPELLPFSEKYQVGDCTFAPDGQTIFFQSNVKLEGLDPEGEGGNIYYVKKTDSGWTEPKHVGFEVNTKYHDSYPCVAADGTLYFFSRRPGGYGKSDMYYSRLINGKYTEPVNLGENFNTDDHEWDPFIAPDKSYLIFCSYKGSLGSDDFFISFKKNDGSWSKPVHMGDEINSTASDNRPFVTYDGKYFFYTSQKSGNRDIYWVSTKIFDRFKKMVK